MGGSALRQALERRASVALIGIYDVFSATVAAKHFDGLFVSGFSFAASHYGLPDVGFIAWTDIVDLTRRLRTVLPEAIIVVDMDDGYGDPEVAAHAARSLEEAGASGVVLEDQQRPKKCGHLGEKSILALDDYLAKLERVLAARGDLFVVARTDADEPEERLRRAVASAGAGADGVLIDGLTGLDTVRRVKERVEVPIAFNQIAGGRSPSRSAAELEAAGVSLLIYSTPCLFAAQAAIDRELASLRAGGRLAEAGGDSVELADCVRLLEENLARRHSR